MSGNGLQQTLEEECLLEGDGKSLVVHVRRSSGLPSEDCRATLIDISRSGVKLSTDDCLLIGEDVSLTFDVSDTNLASPIPAKVRWSQPVDGKTWRIGCAFAPPLSEDTLASLASDGHLQRRQDPRRPISREAEVRWEGTARSIPVEMVDASTGGFCFRSDQDGQDSGRLALQLDSDSDSPTIVRARVQWKQDADDGCLFGCEFASSGDRATFWTVLKPRIPQQQQPEIEPARQVRSLRLAWLVIALIASFVAMLLLR